jgi:hypothetical protein
MHQLGLSGDPAKNFTLSVPAAPDGTMKLARGNAGATTQDILTVDAGGKVAFPQGPVQSGPAFRAVAVGGQPLTSSTAARLNLGTEEFDTDNSFTPSPNRFQPTVAGYYQLNGCAAFQGTTVITGFVQIRKNGTTAAGAALSPTTSSTSIVLAVSDLQYLNGTTDYVELWGGCAGTGTLQIQTPSPYPTAFSGSLVRAA